MTSPCFSDYLRPQDATHLPIKDRNSVKQTAITTLCIPLPRPIPATAVYIIQQ